MRVGSVWLNNNNDLVLIFRIRESVRYACRGIYLKDNTTVSFTYGGKFNMIANSQYDLKDEVYYSDSLSETVSNCKTLEELKNVISTLNISK